MTGLLLRYKLLCGISLLATIACVFILKIQEKKVEDFTLFRSFNQEGWMPLAQNYNYSDYGDNSCKVTSRRAKYLKLMKRWIEIAKEFNLTYFITFGSLLGAWRNQDIIPYDLDMDLSIDYEDNIKLDKLPKVTPFDPNDKDIHLYLHEDWRLPTNKKRFFNCQGKVNVVHYDECSFQYVHGRLITEGVHLDIFNYKRKENKVIDIWRKEHSINDIFPLKKCLFMRFETVCPKNPQAIFKAFYGKNYLRPSRICRNGTWVNR